MEYTKWIKLKQSKMLCYTPYKVPVPLCGGTTAVVQLHCCPFQCMRPIPKNKAYQGQALFAGVKRLRLGNGRHTAFSSRRLTSGNSRRAASATGSDGAPEPWGIPLRFGLMQVSRRAASCAQRAG